MTVCEEGKRFRIDVVRQSRTMSEMDKKVVFTILC